MSKDDAIRDLIERVEKALANHDERAAQCPVNQPSWRAGAKPCPKCGAGTGQSCSLADGAAYAFVTAVRSIFRAGA